MPQHLGGLFGGCGSWNSEYTLGQGEGCAWETSNSAWWELGSGSFPRGCPLSGGHLTLEVELTRPSGAARPQQKWLLHTLTVQGDG